jgi:hypothetical protein
MRLRNLVAALAGAIAVFAAIQPAWAKPARCFTTDDGHYPCDFRGLGGGSFKITAPDKPGYQITIDAPGEAQASGDFGTGRWVPLPGPYFRSQQDGACWVSSATNTSICAW